MSAEHGRASRLLRLLPWVAGVSVFLLISGLIWVSTLKVTHVMRVLGQPRWVAGDHAALRIGVVEVESGRSEPVIEVALTLIDPQARSRPLFDGRSEGTATVEVNLKVPELAPGMYRLQVETRWADEEQERREIAVEILPPGTRIPPPPSPGADPDEFARRVVAVGEARALSFDVIPTGPALVSNMDNELLLLAVDSQSNRPVKAEISVEQVPGEHGTDEAGLASLVVQPKIGREFKLSLRASAEDGRQGQAEAFLPLPPVQVRLLPKQRVVKPGGELLAHVGSLRGQADLHCDLWAGGQWVSTQARPVTAGEAEFVVRVPGSARGPLRLQAYLNATDPGRAHDHRVVIAGELAEGPAVVRALLDGGVQLPPVARHWAELPAPGEGAGYSAERLTRAALALAAGEFWPTPVLLDSYARKQAELQAYVSRIRGVLVALLGGGGGLFLVVLFAIVGGHHRRTRRTMAAAMEEHGDFDDDEERDRSAHGVGLEMLALMGIMVLALAGLIYLLVNLKWRM